MGDALRSEFLAGWLLLAAASANAQDMTNAPDVKGPRVSLARVDQEGRTLLHEMFATAGDIRVCDSELHITLAPLSSPHRTHAAQALCEMLNQTATIFPGSRLRMRFAVRPPPRIGLAFPGSPVAHSAPRGVELP